MKFEFENAAHFYAYSSSNQNRDKYEPNNALKFYTFLIVNYRFDSLFTHQFLFLDSQFARVHCI